MYMEKIEGMTVKQWLQEREGDFGTEDCIAVVRELGLIIAKVCMDVICGESLRLWLKFPFFIHRQRFITMLEWFMVI